MSSKPGKHERTCKWIPSDRKVTEKWLAGLQKKLETKYKNKLKLMMELHPQAEDEEIALEGHPHVGHVALPEKLVLHPPVQALLDGIITDPGKQLSNCGIRLLKFNSALQSLTYAEQESGWQMT